eukprot:g4846.t1
MAREVLRPLGMANATFAVAEALAGDRIATGAAVDGSRLNFSATCAAAPAMPGSFSAPCGCLWASADDVARLLKLFFRDEAPADPPPTATSPTTSPTASSTASSTAVGAAGNQILDGDTLREVLGPAVLLRDGSSAVGSGAWEMKYSSGVWVKSKQGELPGYRSSVSLVEDLKVGVFTSALVSDVAELSVWTVPAMDILVPAVRAALWALQAARPPPPLPSRHALMVGDYYEPNTVSVRLGKAAAPPFAPTLYLHTSPDPGDVLNLTAVPGFDPNRILRAFPAANNASSTGASAGASAGCRWLDDGPAQELVAFDWTEDGSAVHGLRFMGGSYFKMKATAAAATTKTKTKTNTAGGSSEV